MTCVYVLCWQVEGGRAPPERLNTHFHVFPAEDVNLALGWLLRRQAFPRPGSRPESSSEDSVHTTLRGSLLSGSRASAHSALGSLPCDVKGDTSKGNLSPVSPPVLLLEL